MLDKMQKVLSATKDLREQRGRLSAKLIADLYGINQAELARGWASKSRLFLKRPMPTPYRTVLNISNESPVCGPN
jgi:hypothetical protein